MTMSSFALQGIVCKMCGNILSTPAGEPTACMACEIQLATSAAEVEQGDETRDIQNLISGPYLTAACVMVSEQIIHRPQELRPETRALLTEETGDLLRHHAPVAYAFYFQQFGGKEIVPSGTIDIILDLIWRNPLTSNYLGGKNHGIIIPGRN